MSNEGQSNPTESGICNTYCSRFAQLDAWSARDWKDGVQVDRMQMLDTLFVQTQNSLYEVTVLNPADGEVLVRGGRFFPERTPARLSGSTFGGSFLKLRGIYVGFKMELVHQDRTIITSPVQTIATHA
jgi:hypothetical protein